MPIISSLVNVSGTFVTGTTISHIGVGAIGYTGDTDAFSSGTIVFSGNNITVSTSTAVGTQYVLLSGHASSTGMALQGSGTYTQNTGTIQFSNSNGLTFGLHTDGYMTGSHNAFYNSSQLTNTFLTTAMQSVCTSVFGYTSNSSLLQHTSATSAITSNAVNTSISSQWLTTAMANENTSLFQYTSATSGITSDAVNTSVTSQWLTTGALSNHSHGDVSTVSTAGSDLVFTSASNGLTLGIPAWLTTANSYTGISGIGVLVNISLTSLNTTYTSGTVIFMGNQNITVSKSINGVSQYVSFSVGNYITTAMESDAGSNFIGLATTGITGGSATINSSQLLINVPGGGFELLASGNTDGTITNIDSGTLTLVGGDNITLSQDGNELVVIGAASGTAAGIAIQGGSGGTYGATDVISNGTVSLCGGDAVLVSQNSNEFVILMNTNHLLQTSVSSVFQHTSATSLITASAVNTSVTSNYQLIANSTLSLGTEYSSHTHSDLYIALANSTDYATSVLSGTFQTTGAYLTTAMASDQGSNYVGLATTGITNASATINSSQLLIDLPAYLTTAAVSNHSHGNPTLNLTNLTGTTASASNGMTLSLSGPAHGNVYYVDSNGFSFSSSVDGVSTSIWIVT